MIASPSERVSGDHGTHQSGLPTLSVIIVNYNSGARLAKCLDHLFAQTVQPVEIIIADNGSSDTSFTDVQEAGLIRKLDLKVNKGFATANNLAALQACGEWLIFLNPDAFATPNWLEEITEGIKEYPDADAFGSLQLDDNDPFRLDGAGDVLSAFGIPFRSHFGAPRFSAPGTYDCFAPCAAACAYRRKVFLSLRGFDERFFCYGEDVDLGFRLRLAGGRSVQLASAIVYHEGSGVTGRHSDFTIYHGHRNRIWLFRKNVPLALRLLTLPMRLATDFSLLGRFLLAGHAGPYLKALRDGYLGPRTDEVSSIPAANTGKPVNGTRSINALEVAALLNWSPIDLTRRRITPKVKRVDVS